jgi:hypothetical protein
VGSRRPHGGAVTSLLVLTLVVVVPLLSFLVDLYLLDAARTRCRITVIAQPPPDDTPGHDPTPSPPQRGLLPRADCDPGSPPTPCFPSLHGGD